MFVFILFIMGIGYFYLAIVNLRNKNIHQIMGIVFIFDGLFLIFERGKSR